MSKSLKRNYQKRALILCILLVLIALVCILWIVLRPASSGLTYADIYKDGELLQSILLSDVAESYTFTISNGADVYNEIHVQPGSIGIISASCPDKLCVNQGFIHSSLLPITCLPNRLVIQIRQEAASAEDANITPDIITY